MGWIDRVSSAIDASGLSRFMAPAGPLILMYHGIGGIDGIPIDSLGAQLDAVASRRRVVPLADAVETLDTRDALELAAITFDDGTRDFAELAVPLLRARCLHATVFVPASHIGGFNDWDTDVALKRPIMTAHELRELDPSCVDIGAHGLTHRRLIALDEATLHAETAVARSLLEDACGRSVRLFAYPYGQLDDFDSNAVRAVKEAGFVAACSTHFGRSSRTSDRYRLRRVGIVANDPPKVVERKLEGAYDWTAWKAALGVGVRRVRQLRDGC